MVAMTLGAAAMMGGLSAAGSLAGGLIQANASKKLMKKQYDLNRKWEIERATHAHQWEVQDLENAGLNPILSAGGTGADTGGMNVQPADTSGYTSAAQGLRESLAKTSDIVMEQQKINNETKKTDAEIENLDADTTVKQNQANTIIPQALSTIKTNASYEKLNNAKQATEYSQQQLIAQNIQLMQMETLLKEQKGMLTEAEREEIEQRIASLKEQLRMDQNQNQKQILLNNMEMAYLQSKVGKKLHYGARGMQDIFQMMKPAATVAGFIQARKLHKAFQKWNDDKYQPYTESTYYGGDEIRRKVRTYNNLFPINPF